MTPTAPTPSTSPGADAAHTLPLPPVQDTAQTVPLPPLENPHPTASPYARTTSDPGAAGGSDRILGILSFVGGIASLILGQTIILPIAAIILGHYARRREPAGRTFGTWGIVLGYFALFGWLAVIIVGIVIAAPVFLFAWL
jgi:hypothetical protein